MLSTGSRHECDQEGGDGDGKSDVLLRHTNTTLYVWHLDESSIVNQTLGIPSQGYLPSLDADWSIIKK